MSRFILAAALILAFLSVPFYFLHIQANFARTATTTPPAGSRSSRFVYTNATEDMIFVDAPKPGESLTDTILVTGYARGGWFFEAVFPVELKNKAGVVIGTGQGRAKGEWMTDAFVPFTAEIDLKALYNGPATIVLKKDNPSGDPSRDASVSFPVMIQ